MLYSCTSASQEVSISQVNIEDISINSLNELGSNPEENDIISNFGSPKNRVVVPPQPEWDDGGLQLFYENNTQFYYSKQGDEYFLENITLTSNEFNLILNSDTISIGDPLKKLGNIFKNSYEYFKKNNHEQGISQKEEFYVTLMHNVEGDYYYTTNVTINISNDKIESIYISLIEGN